MRTLSLVLSTALAAATATAAWSVALQPGWPRGAGGEWVRSSPALGDLDGDGDLEVVYGSRDGKVRARHHDGTPLESFKPWPVTGNWVESSPALGDLDGDGDLEVVVGSADEKVYALHHDGTLVAGWPKAVAGAQGWVTSSPALADLDSDGYLEVVVGSVDGDVYAWHGDGTTVVGWPRSTGGGVWSSPAVGDLDGDGSLEVVIGSDDSRVYAWHGNGTAVAGWPQVTADGVFSSPALGDLDGDGTLEVVVGAEDSKVYAWRHDGTDVAGWPQTTGDWVGSSPALGDLDGDGDLEVVVGCQDSKVYAWHGSGAPVGGWPVSTGGWVNSSPALGDLDGDGHPEVVVGGDDGKVYAWHHDGGAVAGWPQATGGAVFSSPAIGDLDADGDVEVVVGSKDTYVYAWSCDVPTDDSLPWPMFQRDARRTGRYALLGPPLDDAAAVGSTVPTSLIRGESQTVEIAMRNLGNTTWTQADGYALSSVNPDDNTTWGPSRVELGPSDSIAPGERKIFSFAITAPDTAGAAACDWRMIREGDGRFGAVSINSVAVHTFADVPPTLSYWRHVEALYRAGITAGCGFDGQGRLLYCPLTDCTRAMMAVFLVRAAGKTPLMNPTPTFADVPDDLPYYGHVERLADQDSWDDPGNPCLGPPTHGCATGPLRFCPDDDCTRAMMAVFLDRACGKCPWDNPTPTFADVDPGLPYYGFVERLADPAFWNDDPPTRGCATNPLRFCPDNVATRAQMAVFLARAFQIPY